MALESTTYISGLVATNPTSSDNISDGDNHIRLLKATVRATFPNITGAVTASHSAINTGVALANSGTNANTANTLVKRDGSGNFIAGTITGALTGNVNGNVTGSADNAVHASRWTTARTISLTGDVSGSTTIRGDANANISVTVADDSHNHIISNVDGLQAALNAKVDDGQVLTNVPSGALFTDTNTTYSVGNGGLTQVNFTSSMNIKLAGIATGATNVTNNNQLTNGAGYVTTDTNTTYTVGNGGLTEINFSSGLLSKLASIETGATQDQTAAQIVALAAGCNAGTVDGYNVVFNQAGTASNTIYFRT